MLTDDEADKRASWLAKSGRLIEAGWTATLFKGVPKEASEAQIDAMKMSFFYGARHMLRLMVSAQAQDVSDAVLSKLISDIQREMDTWATAAREKYPPPQCH